MRAQSDDGCPLRVGGRSVDYSDGGYGVTVLGTNVTVPETGSSWRNRYLEVRGHGSGAVIIPFVGESILFERHYRIATDEFSWELPRGFGEPDETDVETARRELREETGLLADEVTVISRIHADAGIMNDDIAVVATRSNSLDYLTPDGSWEAMGFALVPINELDDFIAAARVNDAITLASLRLLVTMSSSKMPAISRVTQRESGPYGDTVYEKPTFDEIDRLNHGDGDAAAHVTAPKPSDDTEFAGKFDAASQALDDLSDSLDSDDDDYSFDIDDDELTIHDDEPEPFYGEYRTLRDTDGDGRPDALADLDYTDSGISTHSDASNADDIDDDDFAFDDGDDDSDDYTFDDELESGNGTSDAGSCESGDSLDDLDDDELDTYNALFGSSNDDEANAIPSSYNVEAEKSSNDDSHELIDESDDAAADDDGFDDDDYLESDDDDAPADIETDDVPILDTMESGKLKELIAEFSEEHPDGSNEDNGDTDDSSADDSKPEEQQNVSEDDINAGDESDSGESLDSGVSESDDGIDDDTVDNDTDESDDSTNTSSDNGTDDEDNESDDDNDDDDDEDNLSDNTDDEDSNEDDFNEDDDVYDEEEEEEEPEDEPKEPQQPAPPMWATEVITTSNAKPEQIGDVMKFVSNGERSKVGRLIVNFGRREFFIKPIDPDDRVTRLDSHNVGRICNGGLVEFDNDDYEQRLRELLTQMSEERKAASTHDDKRNDSDSATTDTADEKKISDDNWNAKQSSTNESGKKNETTEDSKETIKDDGEDDAHKENNIEIADEQESSDAEDSSGNNSTDDSVENADDNDSDAIEDSDSDDIKSENDNAQKPMTKSPDDDFNIGDDLEIDADDALDSILNEIGDMDELFDGKDGDTNIGDNNSDDDSDEISLDDIMPS